MRFDDDNIPCRLDPEDAIKVLKLKPGADYTPKTETEILWKSGLSIGNPHEDFQGSRELLRSADRTINIAPGTKLYLNLKENKGVIVSGNDIVNLKEPLEIDGIPVLLYGGGSAEIFTAAR